MDSNTISNLSESRPTVLLVDDDPLVREITHRILMSEGVRVVRAGHGMEALELWRQEPNGVDLLLTDIDMPEMNGIELSARLGKQQRGLKTLFVSGFPELIAEADHIPANLFLQKPFTVAELSRKIHAALNTPLHDWQCPQCGGRRYQGDAADNDGQSQTMVFNCADCGTGYFRVAEALYVEGARCPFCSGPTVASGYGFVGPMGQFYLDRRCQSCHATIAEHSPACPAIPW